MLVNAGRLGFDSSSGHRGRVCPTVCFPSSGSDQQLTFGFEWRRCSRTGSWNAIRLRTKGEHESSVPLFHPPVPRRFISFSVARVPRFVLSWMSEWIWAACREASARRGLAHTACVCVSDASGLFGRRVNQSHSKQQACIVLMLRRLTVRSQDGSSLSCRLSFVCTVEDGLFCKGGFGLNITSKETRLPLFPPPVASLQREQLLSWSACCVTLGSF